MDTIIFDMYGVIMKAPEGDLIPYIKMRFPEKTEDEINYLWKEAAFGRMKSGDFFRKMGYVGDISAVEIDYLNTIGMDGAFLETVTRLKKNYRIALLSNDVSDWGKYLRDKYNLNQYFDEIVISGDVGILKPDIKIFELLLEKLKLPGSACYYVDDRERNLSAAEKLGMQPILFNRRNINYRGNAVKSFRELNELLYL